MKLTGPHFSAVAERPQPLEHRGRSHLGRRSARRSPSADRVARGGCPPPALTEPYLCCSHTALRDSRFPPHGFPRLPAGSRPVGAINLDSVAQRAPPLAHGEVREREVQMLWALVSAHSCSDNIVTLGRPGQVPVRVQRDLPLELAVLLHEAFKIASSTFAAGACPPLRGITGLRPSFDGFPDTARRSLICRVIGSLVLSFSRLPLSRNPADLHGKDPTDFATFRRHYARTSDGNGAFAAGGQPARTPTAFHLRSGHVAHL
jgi:hypothetical protein